VKKIWFGFDLPNQRQRQPPFPPLFLSSFADEITREKKAPRFLEWPKKNQAKRKPRSSVSRRSKSANISSFTLTAVLKNAIACFQAALLLHQSTLIFTALIECAMLVDVLRGR